ncbi:hypothetical protein [Tenacibaculum singaporense]|uniref:Uncharacterized protein n=1 Tax=Tenacibaculum singaporense TaxID=2358479 RepID=A0A3S8R833_9FLAO|nr:hypothetical protein [Tenacibaculum singaporense]AZJ35948.1 hypothetical protein D6T69_10590 [Tenacibaculum singaporense]
MLKSISKLGNILNKPEQKNINGGGPGSPYWCNNPDNWGPQPTACYKGQERVYDPSVGYCVCKDKVVYELAL